jgi:hypothetical protein
MQERSALVCLSEMLAKTMAAALARLIVHTHNRQSAAPKSTPALMASAPPWHFSR